MEQSDSVSGRLGERDLGVLQRGLVVAGGRVGAGEADVHRPDVAESLGVLLEHLHRFLVLPLDLQPAAVHVNLDG
jgi:hypothetical protein